MTRRFFCAHIAALAGALASYRHERYLMLWGPIDLYVETLTATEDQPAVGSWQMAGFDPAPVSAYRLGSVAVPAERPNLKSRRVSIHAASAEVILA
jgi:hypothetical protein